MSAGVLIVGAGGFGQSVADAIASQARYSVAGFVDDRADLQLPVLGHAVVGRVADLALLHRRHGLLVVALGDNRRRRELVHQALALGFALPPVIHPRAWVSPHADIGDGALIMAGATIGTAARVGRGAIVNVGAIVDHHAQVGDFAHLGIGAGMAGGARLGPGAWLQEARVLGPGSEVPADTVVPRQAGD